MMKKRILAAILAAQMILLASCGEGAGSETTGADNSTSENTATDPSAESVPAVVPEDTETEEDSRKAVSDDLPEYDFNGQSFRVLASEQNSFEFYAEDLTGEMTNDAIYNRNIQIEERFDTKIETTEMERPDQKIVSFVEAGEAPYDIVAQWAFTAYIPLTAMTYRNWMKVPYVNFDKPWWNKLANDSATINGILFTPTGDLALTSLLFTYGIFFNYSIIEDFSITADSLYQAVYEGKWTIDYMSQVVENIYDDVNGNGERDDEDVFGFGSHIDNSADVWLAAFDQPLSGRDEAGNITVEFMTEKTVGAIEKVSSLYYNNNGGYRYYGDWYVGDKFFAAEKLAFVPATFDSAFNVLRNMQSTYGILPMPKYDEEQQMYMTNAWDQYSVYGIPKTVYDDGLTIIGIMTEALAAETYKTVFPIYYDVVLKNRYSADEDAANMVDLIMAGRNFDFAFMFGLTEFCSLPYMFRDMLSAKTTDVASKYAGITKMLKKKIPKISEYFVEQ